MSAASLSVQAVQLPQDAARFIKAWWPICSSNPHWVPPLILERKQFLDPAKNPFFTRGRVQCFMAYRGSECVGTISAQVDEALQQHEPGVGFFGFFEFVDDAEVASALADAACNWLREQGMLLARGPFSFNANHEFGALVDGFDTDPCIGNPTNPAYYDALYQAAGFSKAKDWYAYWFDTIEPPAPIVSVGERFSERNPEVRIEVLDKANWEQALGYIHEIYNDAWSEQWSHSRMTQVDLEQLAENVRPLIEERLIWFAFVGDELAAFSLSIPDWNPVAKRMNGRILPIGWFHFLAGRKRIQAMRVWIMGVKKKFQHLPIGIPLYLRTWEEARKMGYKGAEASLIIEDNYRMKGSVERLGGRVYKTYRIYERQLAEQS